MNAEQIQAALKKYIHESQELLASAHLDDFPGFDEIADDAIEAMQELEKHSAPSPLLTSVEEAVRNAAKALSEWVIIQERFTPQDDEFIAETIRDSINSHLAPILAQGQPGKDAGEALANANKFFVALEHSHSMADFGIAQANAEAVIQAYVESQTAELREERTHLRNQIDLRQRAYLDIYSDNEKLRAQIADLERRLKAKAAAFGKSV